METRNINFVCVAEGYGKTTFAALVIDPKMGKIIDRKEALHNLHAADEWMKEKYEHDLTVGECFESYFAWRAARNEAARLASANL